MQQAAKIGAALGSVILGSLLAGRASGSGIHLLDTPVPGTGDGTGDGTHDDSFTHREAVQGMIDRILSGVAGWGDYLARAQNGMDDATVGYVHPTSIEDIKKFIFAKAVDVIHQNYPDATGGDWRSYTYPGCEKYVDSPFRAIQRKITRILSGVDGWDGQLNDWRILGMARTQDDLAKVIYGEAITSEAGKFDGNTDYDGKGTILDFASRADTMYHLFNYSGISKYVGDPPSGDSNSDFDWAAFWNDVVKVVDAVFGGGDTGGGTGDTGGGTGGGGDGGYGTGGTGYDNNDGFSDGGNNYGSEDF